MPNSLGPYCTYVTHLNTRQTKTHCSHTPPCLVNLTNELVCATTVEPSTFSLSLPSVFTIQNGFKSMRPKSKCISSRNSSSIHAKIQHNSDQRLIHQNRSMHPQIPTSTSVHEKLINWNQRWITLITPANKSATLNCHPWNNLFGYQTIWPNKMHIDTILSLKHLWIKNNNKINWK